MAKQMINVQWKDHQSHFGGVFFNLLESETLVDLTLCAEGGNVSCHRIILSACSSYFKVVTCKKCWWRDVYNKCDMSSYKYTCYKFGQLTKQEAGIDTGCL